MIAGKTNIDCGTKIKTTLRWDRTIITGIITHPFGCFGKYDYGAVAGIRIDKEFHKLFGKIGNLMSNDFTVIKQAKNKEE